LEAAFVLLHQDNVVFLGAFYVDCEKEIGGGGWAVAWFGYNGFNDVN
jgi:hypothetical protein